METNYKKEALAIAGGIIIASTIKAAVTTTVAAIGMYKAKRKIEKQLGELN